MFFTISEENNVTGFHSHECEWPSTIRIIEATDALIAAFYSGCTVYDPSTGAFTKPPFTDADSLRTAMIRESTSVLNGWAKEKHYTDLADLISFTNSSDAQLKADAEAGIAARDKMRAAVLAYVAGLTAPFSVTLATAMGSITKPTW